MNFSNIAAIIFLVAGLVLLIIVYRMGKGFGVLTKERVYQDTEEIPGEVLKAKSIPLVGKPDYLIKVDGEFIPVEVKTGKTPSAPRLNHTMQLMAYCLLVEETYGIRPTGGYLKYPNAEFHLKYGEREEASLRMLVEEILTKKASGEEFFCNHTNHN